MELPEKIIKLRSLNPHIVCLLCAGYFVEATTIVECLHTFCKSCIVRYLQSSKFCPTCGTLVHETEPLSNIKTDRTMQDVMEKILPNIGAKERKSEQEFMENIRKKKTKKEQNNIPTVKPQIDLTNFPYNYRYNEQFNLCFELDRNGEMWLDNMEVVEIHSKYIRCPGRMKILHLKKLLRKFYEPYCSKFEIKVKCNNYELEDSDHLRLIYIIHWKRKPQPIVLYYGFKKWNGEVNMLLDDCISKIESEEGTNSNDKKNSGAMKLDKSLSGFRKCSDEVKMLLHNCISKVESWEAINPDDIKNNGTLKLKKPVTQTGDKQCKMSCEISTPDLPNLVETVDQQNKSSCDVSPADVSNSFSNSSNVGSFTGESLKLCKQELGSAPKVTVKSLDSFKAFNGGIVNNSLLYTSNHACLTVT